MREKFHCLVVDTTAFLNNVSLQDYAEYLITVPEVVKEIKNKRQLKRLCVLPYELTVDEPSPEAVKHVIEFAKRTGDYRSLSSADIKVIALTYQLEKELIGDKHLRTDPITPKVIASKTKPQELLDTKPLAGFYMPPTKDELLAKSKLNANADLFDAITKEVDKDKIEIEIGEETKEDDSKETIIEKNLDSDSSKIEPEKDQQSLEEEDCDELDINLEKLTLDGGHNVDDILVKIDDEKVNRNEKNENSEEDEEEENNDGEASEEESDNESSWITPSNIEDIKSTFGKDVADDIPVRVACMSTDYAIQNVLKQINLNISALDGKIIKQMRTYILRCYGCFKTTSIMTKMFCPNCGHKTLKRVAVSLDENGQQVIHINTRRAITAKGKNTSIPRPRGGKHSSNPILFEDQPIPKQMPSRVARTKTNALEEDYVAGYSPFVRRDVDSKSALLRAKHGENIKQWARNHAYRNLVRSERK